MKKINKYNLDKENKVTDEKFFNNRRKIMVSALAFPFLINSNAYSSSQKKLSFNKDLDYSTNEKSNKLPRIIIFMN